MEESKSYSIEKLTETNYLSWAEVIEAHLDDQGLWALVNGSEPNPSHPTPPTTSTEPSESSTTQATPTAEDATAIEAWEKKARKARKLIVSTISPSVMTYVRGMKDPAKIWKTLQQKYQPKTRVTLRQLQRKFNNARMTDDDGDMEKHLTTDRNFEETN